MSDDRWLGTSAQTIDAAPGAVDALRIGVIGTRHVHSVGLARGLMALGHTIVGAAESTPDGQSAWDDAGLAPLVNRDALLGAVDAVIVAGTNSERVNDTCVVLEAGLPVLTEKPLAITADGLERLRAYTVGGSAGVKATVALPVRFAAAMHIARESIRAGQIGRPLAGRGTNHGQFPGGWFGSKALAGGGAIMDHTIHVADGLCWLLDDTVDSVYAVASDRMHDLEVEDCGVVSLRFSSGFFASIDASWSRPESFHTWGDVWIEIVGDEGRLIIDPMARHLKLYDDRAGKLRTEGYGDDMTRTLLSEFVDYAQGKRDDSPVPLAQGIHGTEIVLAAYRSVASGKTVSLT